MRRSSQNIEHTVGRNTGTPDHQLFRGVLGRSGG
jgi:hypothetical protein